MSWITVVLQYCSLITSATAVLSILVKPIRERIFGISDVREGNKCLLRAEMLRIYYDGKDHEDHLRQHEYENFVLMYQAYKAMKGNSFIDKIYKEVQLMEIIT